MNKVKIWFTVGELPLSNIPDLEITGIKCSIENGFYWMDIEKNKAVGINVTEIRKIEVEIL